MKQYLSKSIFLYFVFGTMIFWSACTPPPQLISKEAYSEAKKKATKYNDVQFMLLIADAYKGDMFTSRELRDFANAYIWYQQALGTNKEKVRIAKSLFEMYMIGDEDFPQDLTKAQQWLQLVADSQDVHLYYEDNTDLYAMDMFEAYKEASKEDATADELFKAGRFLLEYQVDFNMGINFLDKASVKGNPDASYVKAKWTYFKNHRRTLSDEEPFEYQKQKAHEVMKQYADSGSEMAKLEYAYYLVATTDQPKSIKAEVEKLLHSLTLPKHADKEQLAKALYLKSKVQQGQERILTLRQLAKVKNDYFDASQFPFMKKDLEEYKKIETQLQTLTGLGELAKERPDLIQLPFDLPSYYQNYNGDISPLIQLKEVILKPENEEFLTPQNIEKYKQTILEQVEAIFRKANTPAELYTFKVAMEKDSFFKPLAKPYTDSLIQKRLDMLGLVQEDLVFEYEKQRLKETKFKDLTQGRLYIQNLMARDDLDPMPQPKNKWSRPPRIKPEPRKNALLLQAKRKILDDVYGDAPTVKQIETINREIYKHSWLSPVGAEWAANLKQDSESWFTGLVDVPQTRTQYFYEIKRLGESNQFLMEVKSIKNNKSNNAYSTRIEVEKIIKDNGEVEGYNITILGSKYKTYGWKQSEKDYFRVICKKSADYLEDAICTGFMMANHDKSNNPDFLKKKETSTRSQKDAIRAVVRYFILEMYRNFGIN